VAENIDDDRFNVAEVAVQIEIVIVQVENGITNKLAGAVIRDVPPPVVIKESYPILHKLREAGKKVGRVAGASDRIDRLVFCQQQRIRDSIRETEIEELSLQFPAGFVFRLSKVDGPDKHAFGAHSEC
jgi:hypothetical protein